MVIREYSKDDWDDINNLLVQLQDHLICIDPEKVQIMTEKYHKEYLSRLLGLLQDNNGKMFVAVCSNQIAGAIAGIIEPKDEDDCLTNRCPKRGKVLELIVSDENRSGGIGTALLQTIEAYFRQQSCEFVAVDVFAPNKKALAFYEHNNYSPRNIEIYKRLRVE